MSSGMHSISRRAVLAGTGAGLAAAALGGRAMAQGTPHRFKVGAAEVTLVSDGNLTLPLGFVLPEPTPDEVVALFRSQGQTYAGINPQVNVAVIRLGSELILVDTGGGTEFLPTLGKLEDGLDAAGVKPEAVTKVVFTHAHADHLWGVIDPLDGGTRFTNARHIITAAERDYWMQPGLETRVGETMQSMVVGTQRRMKVIADRLEIRRPGEEIAPGVALIDTRGHTPGHVSVLLQQGGDKLIIGGDALSHHVVSFAAPGWRWGPDMDHETAAASRRRLLDQLVAAKSELVGYHLPWPGRGRVERAGTAYRFVPGT